MSHENNHQQCFVISFPTWYKFSGQNLQSCTTNYTIHKLYSFSFINLEFVHIFNASLKASVTDVTVLQCSVVCLSVTLHVFHTYTCAKDVEQEKKMSEAFLL